MDSRKESINSDQLQSQIGGKVDSEKFLGEQVYPGYRVSKQYIQGSGKHLRLYHRRYIPDSTARATLCIIHGFGEHSGRFSHIAEFFCKRGFEILMIDLRGFGYSGGPRGAAHLSQLITDTGTLLEQANPQIPLFLYGHSMGGLIVLNYANLNQTTNFAGVIATSPLIGFPVDRNITWIKVKLLSLMSKDLEDLLMNSMVNPTALTKNDRQMEKAFGDRLMIPFLGLNMGASLLRGVVNLKANCHLFKKPVLLLHGKLDSVTNYNDSIYFYDHISSTEKSIKLFTDGYHELQHDDEYEEMRDVISDWLERRLENAQPFGRIQSIVVYYPHEQKKFNKKKALIIILIILYLFFVIKLRKHPQATSFIKKLLMPFLLVFQKQAKTV